MGSFIHPMHYQRRGGLPTTPRLLPAVPARHEPARLRRREERADIITPQGPGAGPWPQPSFCQQNPQLCSSALAQAIIGLLDLANALTGLFTGVPRSLKSLEVVQRIAQLMRHDFFNPLCSGKCLAAVSILGKLLDNMLNLIRGGDVLSESGTGQRRFYDAIHRAAEQMAQATGQPVHQIERDLTTSIFGGNDNGLRGLFTNLERQGLQQPSPQGGGGGGGGGSPAGGGGGGSPSTLTDCAEACSAARLAGPEAYATCIATCGAVDVVAPAITFASQNYLQPAIQQAIQFPEQLGERIGRFLRPGNPPLSNQPQEPPREPLQPLEPQPIEPFQPIAPLLDTTTPCPECDGARGRLARQRQQLEDEIRAEVQQETQQQIAQQQQEIDRLRQLEQQPAQQRDIPQELQQKQQLLQQVERELEQQPSQSPSLEPSQPAQPALRPGERVPLLEIPPGEQQAQDERAAKQLEQRAQLQPKSGVTFCVGCQSNEDAILFLNGEPSSCSVIPGSTKEM